MSACGHSDYQRYHLKNHIPRLPAGVLVVPTGPLLAEIFVVPPSAGTLRRLTGVGPHHFQTILLF